MPIMLISASGPVKLERIAFTLRDIHPSCVNVVQETRMNTESSLPDTNFTIHIFESGSPNLEVAVIRS